MPGYRMKLADILPIALETFNRNRLRAFLTMLGVIIGVATVISMVGVIRGFMGAIEADIADLGSHTFMVNKFPAMITSNEEWLKYFKRKDLTVADAEAIAEQCDAVLAVSPRDYSERTVTRNAREIYNVGIVATDANFPEVQDTPIEIGRFFTDFEARRRREVCLVGYDVVDELFPDGNFLDQYVHIDGVKYRIIGVLERRGKMMGQPQDKYVIIPIPTYQKYFGSLEQLIIMVRAKSVEQFNEAQDQVINLLRQRRGVPTHEANDFEIMTAQQLLAMLSGFFSTAFIVMIAVAGTSLLVGGIGLMNIMLVSVTERTREIGVRRAMGAKRKDILVQFLMEALFLTMLGGAIGIIVGAVGAWAIKKFTPIPASVDMVAVIGGVVTLIIVGLISGSIPAAKAAKLDPITALRYE
jgi:putative ABC transport system permease protein